MVTLWEKSLKICESLKQPCKRQFNVEQSKIAQEEEENARLERQKTSGRSRQRFSETRAAERTQRGILEKCLASHMSPLVELWYTIWSSSLGSHSSASAGTVKQIHHHQGMAAVQPGSEPAGLRNLGLSRSKSVRKTPRIDQVFEESHQEGVGWYG